MPDDTTLTDAELNEMERRAAAAAPAPWIAFMESRFGTGGASMIQVGQPSDVDDEIYVRRCIGSKQLASPNEQLDADIDFIAAARQDVPRLIAEVRRLRAVMAEAPHR